MTDDPIKVKRLCANCRWLVAYFSTMGVACECPGLTIAIETDANHPGCEHWEEDRSDEFDDDGKWLRGEKDD